MPNGKRGPANNPVTIPHYSGPRNPSLPNYRKGQWEGILTLNDNSKLIVNAYSKTEAERVIKWITRYINPTMLTKSFPKFGQRKGQPLKTILVTPRQAKFFPTGQQNMSPQWSSKF